MVRNLVAFIFQAVIKLIIYALIAGSASGFDLPLLHVSMRRSNHKKTELVQVIKSSVLFYQEQICV